jgi:hypothetical protein
VIRIEKKGREGNKGYDIIGQGRTVGGGGHGKRCVEITGERTRKEENKEWRGEKEVEERPEQRRREKRGLERKRE